jgi:hypothetical protein
VRFAAIVALKIKAVLGNKFVHRPPPLESTEVFNQADSSAFWRLALHDEIEMLDHSAANYTPSGEPNNAFRRAGRSSQILGLLCL